MTPAGGEHGQVALRVGARILAYVEEQDLGAAFAAETGFVLNRGPDTVRAPDVAFVARSRLSTAPSWGFPELAPDLVVEVVSPWDRASEVSAKAATWLDAGVRLVWVVDPQARLATVHHQGARTPCCARTESSTARTSCPASGFPWRRSSADQSTSGGSDGSSWCSKTLSSRRAEVRPLGQLRHVVAPEPARRRRSRCSSSPRRRRPGSRRRPSACTSSSAGGPTAPGRTRRTAARTRRRTRSPPGPPVTHPRRSPRRRRPSRRAASSARPSAPGRAARAPRRRTRPPARPAWVSGSPGSSRRRDAGERAPRRTGRLRCRR